MMTILHFRNAHWIVFINFFVPDPVSKRNSKKATPEAALPPQPTHHFVGPTFFFARNIEIGDISEILQHQQDSHL